MGEEPNANPANNEQMPRKARQQTLTAVTRRLTFTLWCKNFDQVRSHQLEWSRIAAKACLQDCPLNRKD